MNRGFLYGDGFFESFKVVDQVPVFWDYHFKRIGETSKYLELDLEYSEIDLKKSISAYLQNQNIVHGRLRISFFRQGEGKYLPEQNGVELAFQAEKMDEVWFEKHTIDHIHISTISLPKHELGNHKIIGKSLQIKAALEAKRQNAQEAIMLNDRGEVCEGISGNIFGVFGNRFITPPLTSGCLSGTIRALLLEKYEGIQEAVLSVDELLTADAIIFTNAVSGFKVYHQNQRWKNHDAMLIWLNQHMISSKQDFQEIRP